MQYTMKSGILYQEQTHEALARIRNMMIGSAKKIFSSTGEQILETGIRYLDEEKAYSGDVRNREYIMTDPQGNVAASAFPQYAQEENPDVAGWPVYRMPRVDHARVIIEGSEYTVIMYNSQNYTMKNSNGDEILRILHKGVYGGWILEDNRGFTPGILCGIFTFCRYIELENEFIAV